MSVDLRYWRLLLDGRPSVEVLDGLLRRLAQQSAPRPLVFETTATATGVTTLIASTRHHLPELRSLLQHLLGVRLVSFDAALRPRATAARTLALRSPGLPLAAERTEEVVHALYESFTRVRGDEALVLQVVMGPGRSPRRLSPRSSVAPSHPLLAVLSVPPPPVDPRTRTRLEAQAAEVGISLSVRLGVRAAHPDRTRELLGVLAGALHLLDAPGGRIALFADRPDRLAAARGTLVRRVLLSTPEAVPLLGLPASDRDLPGFSLHPRRPLAPLTIENKELVFAETSTPGDERRVGIAPDALLQHMVITGPTGAGKSTVIAAIAEGWIRARRPVALLDPKRQLVDHLLARLPKSAAGRVVVLDPTDSPVVGFNPLDIEGRSADVAVDGILSALRSIFEDGWGPRTEDLLLAGLRSLALAGARRSEPYTLIDLPRLYTDAALRREVVGRVADDPVLASFWAAFEGQSEAARAAQVAAPLNKLRRFLLRPNLVAVLGQPRPRFRVRALFAGDRALLVPLNDALIGPGSAQLLGSLLVAELFSAAQERALESDPRERPGLVAVDEAQRFIHLPTALEDALATSRSYGVAWLAAHQYRAQLGPGLRAGFDSNALSKLVYRSAHDDARDYARMSRTLTPDDFMSLPPHELYATLQTADGSTPWFAARALPPRPELGFADVLQAASRERFGAEPLKVTAPSPPPSTPTGRKPRAAS